MKTRHILHIFLCFVFVLWCDKISFGAGTIIDHTEHYVLVKADGVGIDKIKARNDAWAEAIRTAVGFYITTGININNDEINEIITSYSSGTVESYQPLSEKYEDGLWHVLIKAKVEKDKITESTKKTSKIALSTNKLSKVVTDNQQGQNAIDTIKNFMFYNDVRNILKYDFDIQKIDNKFYAFHLIKINMKNYKNIIVGNTNELMRKIAYVKYESFPRNSSKQAEKYGIEMKFSIPKNIAEFTFDKGKFFKIKKGSTLLSRQFFENRHKPFDFDYKKNLPKKYRKKRKDTYEKTISVALDHTRAFSYMLKNSDLSTEIWRRFVENTHTLTFCTEIQCDTETLYFESDPYDVRFFVAETSSNYREDNLSKENRKIILPKISIVGEGAYSCIFISHELALPSEKLERVTNISGKYELVQKL